MQPALNANKVNIMSSEVLRSCARLVASCTSRSQVLSHHGVFPSASSNHAQRLLFSANFSVAVPSLIHASSWAAWGSRTWSSQSSQPSGNEKKKKSQKTEANANVPSASNPTTQETAHAAPASAPMPASQPSGVMMQERETIQQIRARIFGEPILPGECYKTVCADVLPTHCCFQLNRCLGGGLSGALAVLGGTRLS